MIEIVNNIFFVLALLWLLWSFYSFFKKGYKIVNLDLMGSKSLFETKTIITILSFGYIIVKSNIYLGLHEIGIVITILIILMLVGLYMIDKLKRKRGLIK